MNFFPSKNLLFCSRVGFKTTHEVTTITKTVGRGFKCQNIEQKGGKGPKKEYTPIKSYKPSGNLIYDDELLNKIEDRFL